jgi:hypothetical protein
MYTHKVKSEKQNKNNQITPTDSKQWPHTNNNTRNCGRFSAKSSGSRQGVKKIM